MDLLALLRRHPPGWLALAVVAAAMAVCTWPQRLDVDSFRQMLRQPWLSETATTSAQPPADAAHPLQAAMAGGFDAFSRATGTALPVLATLADSSPQPPGATQIVRCRVSGRVVYADSWSACPRGIGELLSLAR